MDEQAIIEALKLQVSEGEEKEEEAIEALEKARDELRRVRKTLSSLTGEPMDLGRPKTSTNPNKLSKSNYNKLEPFLADPIIAHAKKLGGEVTVWDLTHDLGIDKQRAGQYLRQLTAHGQLKKGGTRPNPNPHASKPFVVFKVP